MSISGISGLSTATASLQTGQVQKPTPADQAARVNGPNFTERLGGALRQVAESQNSAAQAAKDFELGKRDDLASVMVEQQVASLGFQMTLSVRNKALTAYRDIMNMPV